MEPPGRLCRSSGLSVALTAGRNQLSHTQALLPTNVCGRSLRHHIIEKGSAGWSVEQKANGGIIMLQEEVFKLGLRPPRGFMDMYLFLFCMLM